MLKNALLMLAILLAPTQRVNALEKIINGMPPSFEEYFNDNLSSYEQPLPPVKFNWLEPHKIEELKFFEKIPNHYEALVYDVAYLQILSFSFLLGIWVTPESISNWNRKDIIEDGFGAKWVQHVNEGPVVDKDGFFYNYIGHPLGGAYYYTLARNNDLTIWESTVFTFLMSTVYWEYGFEAIFEIPSIQDLIITPVIGPLIGEGFYQLSL
ncbi:MAG: DUF3943 domain-containing protein, partial [Thiovulaceae bacterium]|nr:DUF3943 domain-containing protein [Sulfurimonadaceae bacterium]